jgi:hypothetical protein
MDCGLEMETNLLRGMLNYYRKFMCFNASRFEKSAHVETKFRKPQGRRDSGKVGKEWQCGAMNL